MDLLPLEEGVLTVNFGMPLMIVCNKSEKVDQWSSQTVKTAAPYIRANYLTCLIT